MKLLEKKVETCYYNKPKKANECIIRNNLAILCKKMMKLPNNPFDIKQTKRKVTFTNTLSILDQISK